jgi:hypothetical protein
VRERKEALMPSNGNSEYEAQNIQRCKCPHCHRDIEDNTNITTIVSGSADSVVVKDGQPIGNIHDIVGSIVFHDECFVEIAGREYYPREKYGE